MTGGLDTELMALRRRLHAVPEVGLHLPRTRDALVGELAGLPVELVEGSRCTSVTAVLRGARPGPTVLLRSDMDGLPLTERTGLPYAAPAGTMHACGHDLHMAALVGAARLLSARSADLAGTVVLAFQPGEEGHGGARAMIEDGLLDVSGERPAAAYALHAIADLPHGVVHGRPGPVMAGYSVLEAEVVGLGAHGGRPHEGADPVPVAAAIVTALYTYVDRRFDAFDPVVLTVGQLQGGAAPNVVPDTVTLRAGVRSFGRETTERVARELPALVEGIAAAHGIAARVTWRRVMEPTVNDPASADLLAGEARALLGDDRYVTLEHPRTGSEDFSEILARVPGAFAYMGAAARGTDPGAGVAGNHAPTALFDDSVVGDMARLLGALALRHLTAPTDPRASAGRDEGER